jgi:hypothetical protein
MSYLNNAMAACPNSQMYIDDAFMTPGMFPGADDRMPFSEFLNSPENRRRISYEITPGRGKVRAVEVVNQQRRLESTVLTNQPNPNCQATNKYGENLTTYDLDTDVNLQANQTIEITDYERSCRDNGALFNTQLMMVVDVMDRKVATQQAIQAAALTGKWGASVTVNGQEQIEVATLITGGNPNFSTWNKIRNAAEDSGFPDSIALFGGQTMREYFQYVQAGCCADFGLDFEKLFAQYGYGYAFDKRVKDALGSANEFMVVAPGALQPISYSRAEGKVAMGAVWAQGSDYFYSTIRSPRFGVPYDLTVKDSCGTLSMTLTYTGKVIAMPTDLFAVGDEYEGVTYAAQGVVVNP